jgi:hypothetical protein
VEQAFANFEWRKREKNGGPRYPLSFQKKKKDVIQLKSTHNILPQTPVHRRCPTKKTTSRIVTLQSNCRPDQTFSVTPPHQIVL